MSSGLIQNPLEPKMSSNEKNYDIISKKSKTKKSQNKENIPNNIQPKKLIEEEDVQSSKKLQLKEIKEDNYDKNSKKDKKIKNLSKKDYEKYEKKMKERTMRNEVDKIYEETERLKNEYEARNSNYFLFNNPQFKKMINVVQKQLYYILSLSALLIFSSIFIGTKLSKEVEGISLTNIIISTLLFATSIILLSGVKLGLLNDPELSRTFRFFVILESLLLIISFCFNITSFFLNYNNNKISTPVKLFSLLLIILTVLDLIFIFKNCLSLFVESYMILFGKKTEYSALLLKDKYSYNRSTSELNLNTSLNNEALDKTNTNFIEETSLTQNFDKEKLDDNYKNFILYNRFHYSVSSYRQNDKN